MYVYLIACTNHTKLATTMFLDKAAILFSISISRKLSKNVYDHTGCSNMD